MWVEHTANKQIQGVLATLSIAIIIFIKIIIIIIKWLKKENNLNANNYVMLLLTS